LIDLKLPANGRSAGNALLSAAGHRRRLVALVNVISPPLASDGDRVALGELAFEQHQWRAILHEPLDRAL